jgi:MYXO-CTERM domain-containing protein
MGLDAVSLPGGTVGVALAPVMFGSTGGIGGVRYGATGALPPGVGFDAGVFSGVPGQTGSFPVTLTATDFNGCVGSQAATLNVTCPAVAVSPTSVAQLTTGAPMTPVQFTLQGSTASGQPMVALTGALPIGLTFTAGQLSGMPTQGGMFPLAVSAMDGFGCTAQAMFALDVALAAGFQATTLALSTPTNPVSVTAPVTISAVLTYASGSPTGTVTFYEGTTALFTGPSVAGLSLFNTNQLGIGNHRITAVYSGDATFGASVAPELSIDVVQVPTTTVLTTIGTRIVVDVTSAVDTVDGDVSLVIDGTPTTLTLGTDGRVRSTVPTAIGPHTLQANYLGTVRFAPSASDPVTVTVEAVVADAGSMEPEVDAGTMEPVKPTGCGCSSADASMAMFGLLALTLRRRR